MQDRRPQVDLVQRELGVLARLAAAGEEGLERLRRELDHAVALDAAGPAAFRFSPLGLNMHNLMARCER